MRARPWPSTACNGPRVRRAKPGAFAAQAAWAIWQATCLWPPPSQRVLPWCPRDAPHVPIYRWNLPVAVSNAQGLAVLTRLVPYQKNLLSIRPQDVPLHYHMDQHEVTAIPHGRGGVWVNLAMLRERPALVTLTLPEGQHLPAGAMVQVASSGESAPVGLRGQVYLRNMAEHDHLDVQHFGQSCRIRVQHPPTADPQPRLGPWVCQWAAPAP